MQRFESVKELIFYCGETDFSHMYDLARIKFLRMVCSKFSYCYPLYCCSEWRYNTLSNLVAFYDVKFELVCTSCEYRDIYYGLVEPRCRAGLSNLHAVAGRLKIFRPLAGRTVFSIYYGIIMICVHHTKQV
jgi:hypothetical protein